MSATGLQGDNRAILKIIKTPRKASRKAKDPMVCAERSQNRKNLTRAAFLLAFLSIIAGTTLCIFKSPQMRGQDYLAAAAAQAADGNQAAAQDLARAAIRLNPSSVKTWNFYAVLMEQDGRIHAAKKARRVSAMLQHGPEKNNPIYAMPATLRLSALADDAAAR